MKISFSEEGWEDYSYWIVNDKKMIKKIHELIKSISKTPFEGIGKPEPLRHNLTGYWSRRINIEHRLVYLVNDESIEVIKCRHYY